jgi:hypothetical protein
MSYVSLQDRLTEYVQSRGWAFGAMSRGPRKSQVTVTFGRRNNYWHVDAGVPFEDYRDSGPDAFDDALYVATVAKLDERMEQLVAEGKVSKEREEPPPPLDMARLLGLVLEQTPHRYVLRDDTVASIRRWYALNPKTFEGDAKWRPAAEEALERLARDLKLGEKQ